MQRREFQRAIKRERKRLGMSQPQLAACLEVHPVTVGGWEQGRGTARHPNAILTRVKKLCALPGSEQMFNKAGRPKEGTPQCS